MTPAELLSRLRGVRKTRDGWMALCPVHDDKNASLSIGQEDGRILLHCFARCDPAAIMAALGLTMADLFIDARLGGNAAARIMATYDYQDETGKLLYQVVRYHPKNFRQRRPDGKGGWVWNLDGVRRVLYRLPEVLKAREVLLVAGEKDADTAKRLGFVATTNSGGEGKWHLTPDAPAQLAGKWLTIIADADAPGRAHAHDVARSVIGVARSVKLIEVLPGVPHKGDLTDFVERGGTREQLERTISEAPQLTEADVKAWTKPNIAVPGVLASEVTPEKVRWLWQNNIPLGKVTIFDGDPELGKSLVSLDLAARLTRGWTMPDGTEAGCPPAGAVIVSLEDGVADTIRPRLEAGGADLTKVRIIQTIAGADGIERTPAVPDDLAAIEAAIRDVNAKLLVLDPLVATLGAETNSYRDQDIRRALAPVVALAERTRVAVLCIRHLNKSGGQNPKYRGGGSIGIIGAARAGFLMAEDPDNPELFIMAPVKGNLWKRPRPKALRYALEDCDDVPHVKWLGETEHTAKSLCAQPEDAEETNACAAAKEFLTEILNAGPRDSKEVYREAKAAGVSPRTLERAKTLMRVKAVRVGGLGKDGHWKWSLPDSRETVNHSAKSANAENTADLGEETETKGVDSTNSAKAAKAGNVADIAAGDGGLTPLESARNGPDEGGCWHCQGLKVCRCIVCRNARIDAPGPCVTCKGTGKAWACVH
jgi:hypothetical protein